LFYSLGNGLEFYFECAATATKRTIHPPIWLFTESLSEPTIIKNRSLFQ
jgi:hypothetical protein